MGTELAGARLREVIAKRRQRLMWLTGAVLSAGAGVVIIVLGIVHALQAEYAEGSRADATGTAGGVGTDGVPSNTGLLIGAALIAAPLLAVLIARVSASAGGRRSTGPAS